MNRQLLHLLTALTTAALGNSLLAQEPVNPPPWWGVQDEVTVSIYWDFSGLTPFTPQVIAAPSWYNNPIVVTQAVPTGPLVILPALNGHTDVLALVGTGAPLTARLDVKVDNDPHVDWVKVFYFQFDEFQGVGGSVKEAIEQDLLQYKQSSVTVNSVSIGQGWSRVTVTAQLIPQPGDEGVDFVFTTNALGSAAVDNLFVSSKCIKLEDSDQDGDAMGEPDGFTLDLTAAVVATGISTCVAAAVTEGPAPGFARTYWISGLAPSVGAAHQIMRLNQTGSLVGSTPLPASLALVPHGASDLAVERITSSTGTITQQFVYAILDQRTSPVLPNVVLLRFDTTGSLVATLPLLGFPAIAVVPQQPMGLAFNPSGLRGQGTFWVTATAGGAGRAFEFSRAGALQQVVGNLPLSVVGAGYDDVFGNLYWFSNAPVASPAPGGNLHVNGYEWSAYDLQPTGVRFFGDLNLLNPNPGGTRGGVASGLEVYRRDDGEFRAVCVVQLPGLSATSQLYELRGPFRWGASLAGTCGMRGLPLEGSNNFQVTLSGVPNATFAALYVGFSPRLTPFNLAPFGMPETNVLINLNLNSTLQLPTAPGSGEFAFPFPLLPPNSGFSYVPMFFQWLVFDPTVQAGVTLSPGGKTLIY